MRKRFSKLANFQKKKAIFGEWNQFELKFIKLVGEIRQSFTR